jgi:preprotein translocase subunit SecE
VNPLRRMRRFLEEAWSELKTVTWPTREQTRNLTVLVFVVSAVVGAYIAVFDAGFKLIVGWLSTL